MILVGMKALNLVNLKFKKYIPTKEIREMETTYDTEELTRVT